MRVRGLSSESLWTFVCAVSVFIAFALKPIESVDSWWPLAAARDLVQRGGFRFEGFAFQPWLSGLLMFELHSFGGFRWLTLALALSTAAAFVALIRYLRVRYPDRARSSAMLVTLTTLLLCTPFFCVRTQTFAIPIFVAFLLICHDWWTHAQDDSRLKYLPLLMLLWVNVHGSFVMGLVLLAGTSLSSFGPGVERRSRTRMLAWSGLCVFATFLNPLGADVYAYVARLAASPLVRVLEEWRPLRPSFGLHAYFFYASLVFGLWSLRRNFGRRPTTALLLAMSIVMAAIQARHILWFAFILSLSSAEYLPIDAESARRPRILNLGVAVALAIGTLAILFGPRAFREDLRAREAIAALRRMAAPPMRLFHSLESSGQLMWFLPGQRPFIDARLESYAPELVRDYIELSSGKNPQELLEKHSIDALLIDRENQSGLQKWAETQADWRIVHSDAHYSIWLPRGH